jgi:hypothetical protein
MSKSYLTGYHPAKTRPASIFSISSSSLPELNACELPSIRLMIRFQRNIDNTIVDLSMSPKVFILLLSLVPVNLRA